jgi:hypothetical protein
MIVWTQNFSKYKKGLGYIRLLWARFKFSNYYKISFKHFPKVKIIKQNGYRRILKGLRDKYKGKRCFIIGNGPSLKNMDLSFLKDEITIGSNGIYKNFDKWGFHTDFLLFEDTEQTEQRGPEIHKIKGPRKMAAIYNAYAFKPDNHTVFFNARRADGYYWKNLSPMFSRDFSEIVYLGSTITYIAMQLAYHLGFQEVYIIGVDHDYGELTKLFPPGKIEITEKNIHLVKGLHLNDSYYKVGDLIGVPHVKYQNDAYQKAKEVFEKSGKVIKNAGVGGKLDIFDRCDFANLFSSKAHR